MTKAKRSFLDATAIGLRTLELHFQSKNVYLKVSIPRHCKSQLEMYLDKLVEFRILLG